MVTGRTETRLAITNFSTFVFSFWIIIVFFFFFQAEDGIRDWSVTGVQTCALPIWPRSRHRGGDRPRPWRLHRPRRNGGRRRHLRDRHPRPSRQERAEWAERERLGELPPVGLAKPAAF